MSWSVTFYRLYQKLCNNAIKHSGASQINFGLSLQNNLYHLNYSDDGVGFDTSIKKDWIGKSSVTRRVSALQVSIDNKSNLGEGAVINIIDLEKKSTIYRFYFLVNTPKGIVLFYSDT